MNDINNSLKMEIQSDVFITLIKHLQDKTEVQNIELMNHPHLKSPNLRGLL